MEMAGDDAGRRHRLRRRRLELRRDRVPVPAGAARGNAKTRFLAVEPASCPSLTKGEYRYDFGDTAGMTPLLKMHTLGNDFRPAPIHAGGLRYHGMAPMVSHLYELGFLEAKAYAPEHLLRGGGPVRSHRGHHPGAGVVACHPCGD